MDASTSMKVPTFTQADLAAFHEAHFGQASVADFEQHFLQSHNIDREQEEEEDDGLGYYPDGVKRTLTDEQIAIFRQSEEEALRRVAEKAKAAPIKIDAPAEFPEQELEEGEEVDEDGIITKLAAPKKNKKKKRKGNMQRKEQKPDLRKRTWDVVESGLGTLDYDGIEGEQASTTHAAQRRRISYDD